MIISLTTINTKCLENMIKNINYYPEFEKKGRGRNVLQLTTEARCAKFVLQSNCNQTLTIFEKWNTIHKTLKIVLFQACPAKTKTKGERDFCWHRDKVSNRAALMWHGRATRHGYPVPHCCLWIFAARSCITRVYGRASLCPTPLTPIIRFLTSIPP